MALRNSADNYGSVARALHWTIAALIACQFVLAKLGEYAGEADRLVRQLALLANHKSVGMTVLMLAVIRLAWRILSPPPNLPRKTPRWQSLSSNVSHWSLYTLIFLIPISGWLMSSASAYTVSWFGWFSFPDLVQPDKALKNTLVDVHELLGEILFVVVLVHIVAALKHHFWNKDSVLKRMTSPAALALFAVVLAGSAYALTRTSPRDATAPSAPPATSAPATAATSPPGAKDAAGVETLQRPQTLAETPTPKQDAPLPVWAPDYDASYVKFSAEQAGAQFTGEWREWTADLRFDPERLAQSRFDVNFSVASVETRDSDRDETLLSSEWFDASEYPSVQFVTRAIEPGEDGNHRAMAELTIKGVSHPIAFDFAVKEDGATWALDGSARLDRLALKLGTGEWSDTEWVGQFVDVEVHVEAVVDHRDGER